MTGEQLDQILDAHYLPPVEFRQIKRSRLFRGFGYRELRERARTFIQQRPSGALMFNKALFAIFAMVMVQGVVSVPQTGFPVACTGAGDPTCTAIGEVCCDLISVGLGLLAEGARVSKQPYLIWESGSLGRKLPRIIPPFSSGADLSLASCAHLALILRRRELDMLHAMDTNARLRDLEPTVECVTYPRKPVNQKPSGREKQIVSALRFLDLEAPGSDEEQDDDKSNEDDYLDDEDG
ncbi:hypothetical protein C8R45DRAFT_936948 [Mycena sanguinolenta]|nr:hypothetical protein C8R45DRAFT_936948 [Mycena sanguinolenta]